MGQEESKRASEPDGQSTPTKKRLHSFQRRSNRLSSSSAVRIPQSPTCDTGTLPGATSGSSPVVFECDSSNPNHLNPFKLPVFEESPKPFAKLKQNNLITSSSLPKFDIPEKPKRGDSLIKSNGAEQFDIYSYSQQEVIYSRSHSDTTAAFTTQTQKSSESIYLSTEDMPADPKGQQATRIDPNFNMDDSCGNLMEGDAQEDETPVPLKNPMFVNLYNPSFDLIDLSPVDDETGQESSLLPKDQTGDVSSSFTEQFFGSSFQKPQLSVELLDQNEDFDFQKTLKANKYDQSSFLMGQSIDMEAEALPIFGLYLSQRESNNTHALSSPFSVRKTELSVQPLSYSVGSGASKDLIQFSSSEQLDNDDNPEQAYQNGGVTENKYSSSGMNPLMESESNFDAGTTGMYDDNYVTVPQRDKHDLVLEELMIGKKNATSQDNLKNAGNFAKVSSIEAFERKSNSSLNFFSPASSTDGIYVINSFERKQNSQPRERSRDSCSSRRTELMDMKYCGEDGQCLVPKTPEDLLDEAPKIDSQTLQKIFLPQRANSMKKASSEGKFGKPLLTCKTSQDSTKSEFNPMPDFEPPPPMNLPTKALKSVDSEIKRKTGSLRLFEEKEQECLDPICGNQNEDLLAIAETSPIAKEFDGQCHSQSKMKDQIPDTKFEVDPNNEQFFEPPENIYATLVKPKNRKSSLKNLNGSSHTLSPSREIPVKDPKLPNKEKILSEETIKQNCNTFVRKTFQSQNGDSTGNEENSQKQQHIQENLNSGTFLRRKTLLKTPVSYKKVTAASSTEMIVDDVAQKNQEKSRNENAEDNLDKNHNSGTFVRKLSKSAHEETKNPSDDPERGHNSGTFLRPPKKLTKNHHEQPKNPDTNGSDTNQNSGTFLRSPKKQAKNSPESSSPDNDPEKHNYAGTFVRPKKRVDKHLIDAPHKVIAQTMATREGTTENDPVNAGEPVLDETAACEKRILAFETDQRAEENEQKRFHSNKVQDVDRAAVSLLAELIEDKMNYLQLHLRLKSQLRSGLVAFSEQSIEDVWALEKKFSVLHRKYEALKAHYESYRDCAVDTKRHISQLNKQINEQSDMKSELTKEMHSMFQRGEQKTEKVSDHWSQKIAQLEAEIKLQTFKNNQLSEKVQQKELENIQVAKLCDEMIAKLNENTEPSTPL